MKANIRPRVVLQWLHITRHYIFATAHFSVRKILRQCRNALFLLKYIQKLNKLHIDGFRTV